MSNDVIKISLLAIAGGIFAVLVCNAQPYVLLAPIISVIVGQTAHAFGNPKKPLNRLIVLIILLFLVVLPYMESHPSELSKMKVSLYQKYHDLLKTVDRIKTSPENKTRNIPEPARHGKATR